MTGGLVEHEEEQAALGVLAIAGCVLAAGFTEAQIRRSAVGHKGRDAKLQNNAARQLLLPALGLSDLPAYEPHESGILRL